MPHMRMSVKQRWMYPPLTHSRRYQALELTWYKMKTSGVPMQRKPRDAAVNYRRKRCLTIPLLTLVVIFMPEVSCPAPSINGK